MPRRISSASRTPSVVSSADLAPVRGERGVGGDRRAVHDGVDRGGEGLERHAGATIAAAMLGRPVTTAIDGSAGVDSTL